MQRRIAVYYIRLIEISTIDRSFQVHIAAAASLVLQHSSLATCLPKPCAFDPVAFISSPASRNLSIQHSFAPFASQSYLHRLLQQL